MGDLLTTGSVLAAFFAGGVALEALAEGVQPTLRLTAALLVRDVMRLAFLIERQYAPYAKWFGTGFARLDGWPVGVMCSDPRISGGAMTETCGRTSGLATPDGPPRTRKRSSRSM